MKEKKQLFQFRLYMEGLKRLRIVGLALAILCVSISILVPISHWMETEERVRAMITPDVLDVMKNAYVTTLNHMTISIPSVVASYVAPVFVFLAFSYLNKRRDSDFYHAIPYTRTCVYISFMAAALTWAWGILLLSSLAGATVWALSPYATFAPLSLLWHILIIGLNALLLCAAAGAAVSLMGTFATSLLSFGLLLAMWRFILFIAEMILDDMNQLVISEQVLGGYLHPSFLLPVSILTESLTASVMWYALAVSIGLLALGGVCYALRKSEVAGRSVPGKWRHIVLRGLLCLPFALVIVYQLIGGLGGDVSLTLVLLVLTLLTFYLYELLTTRSVRSMVRATPWLGAILAACVVFGASVMIGDAVIERERIDADDIRAVGFERSYGSGSSYGMSEYEMYMIAENMSENEQVREIVAGAFAQTQTAARWDVLYDDHFDQYKHVYMRLKLRSGANIVRRVRFENEEYAAMLQIIRDEMNIAPLPTAEHVREMNLHLPDSDYSATVDQTRHDELIQAVCTDWERLSVEERGEIFSYNRATQSYPLLLTMRLQLGEDSVYVEICPSESMTLTRALMEQTMQSLLPDNRALADFFATCEAAAYNAEVQVMAPNKKGSDSRSYYYFSGDDIAPAMEVLAAYATYRLPLERIEDACVVTVRLIDYSREMAYAGPGYISSYSSSIDYAPSVGVYQQSVCLLLDLDDEALEALGQALEEIGKTK